MPFYPEPRPVPAGIRHELFLMEPLSPAHLDRDYAAVMASRQKLRRWSGTSWPADDFTVDGNLEDLEMHFDEQQRRIAFTYTVLSPNGSTCLGCVYITPLTNQLEANPDLDAGPHDAVVTFWTTTGPAGDAIAHSLFATLRTWLSEQWEFGQVVFAVRPELSEQVAFLEYAGLEEQRRVMVASRESEYILFA